MIQAWTGYGKKMLATSHTEAWAIAEKHNCTVHRYTRHRSSLDVAPFVSFQGRKRDVEQCLLEVETRETR